MNTTKLFAEALIDHDPDRKNWRVADALAIAESHMLSRSKVYQIMSKYPRVKRGTVNLEALVLPFKNNESSPTEVKKEKPMIQTTSCEDVYVPEVDPTYIRWGHAKDIEQIIKSRQWFPTYISGLSGNGKTMMVEQTCAKLKREFIRVQISPETDEDDLIGGFRLVNGETVFAEGPVIKAMRAGAILLIDEIDRSSGNKLMCLQGILEGKPVLLKKTGEVVTAAEGFNVIATANTKGKGSESGFFAAASIIDEAFLERFTITVEQPYPSLAVEKKIIMKHFEKFNLQMDEDFIKHLVFWGDTIRKTFEAGGIDELISTRRLCHIIQTFSVFGDRMKAIQLCTNRFDEDTKAAFIDLYTKVDTTVEIEDND